MLEIFELLFDPEINIVIREALPWGVVRFLEIITILGNGPVLFAFAALIYWFSPEDSREERVTILALTVATLALVMGLKGFLEIPRPFQVETLEFAPDTYPGWSTPSAHAMGATAVYGGFAALKNERLRVLRYVGAGLLIIAIALSRVVLGLHYLGDVILGAILGTLLVYLAVQVKKRRSTSAMFGVALILSITGFFLGAEVYITLSIGSALGGLIGWKMVKYRIADPKCGSIIIVGLMLVPIALTLWLIDAVVLGYVGIADIPVLGVPLQVFIQIAGYAILFGLIVALPYLATEINHWSSVEKLEKAIPI